MQGRFVTIDFETANADFASICQVGIVTFEDGRVVESWEALVNPKDYFDWINVDIHGIDETAVADSPTFQQIYSEIYGRLENSLVVSHTSFDRAALSQAITKHDLSEIPCQWLDSARVVRRAWPQWSRSGYGLTNVCSELGITFTAHHAVEDARAAGEVLLRAISASGIGLSDWSARVHKPIDPSCASYKSPIRMDGDANGFLVGEEIVFTGALSLPRREAASLAAKAGCDVAAVVRKTTTLLVVGDQDIQKLAGHDKSSKHRKAEELIAGGRAIRILKESDFLRLVDLAS